MKILIEAMHGLGDVVCIIPMIKEIRGFYHDAEISILVNSQGAIDILKSSGIDIKDFVVIKAHNYKIKALKQCLKLRKRKYDLSVSCANTSVLKSKIVMGLIGAKRTIGIQYESKTSFDTLNDQFHFVEAHLMSVRTLGIQLHGYKPELYPDNDAVKKVEQQLRLDKNIPIIGLCIGRADISYKDKRRTQKVYTRGWGNFGEHLKNMSELICKIDRYGWQIVLIGGREEEEIRDSLKGVIDKCKKVFDMVGNATVSESIALLSLCDVSVGVDTGMQHIADALGVFTVSLFGPTNPKTHGAYSDKAKFVEVDEPCRYCYGMYMYLHCKDRKCMRRITPDMVFKKINEQLERR